MEELVRLSQILHILLPLGEAEVLDSELLAHTLQVVTDVVCCDYADNMSLRQ
jgi:hypothetical protein